MKSGKLKTLVSRALNKVEQMDYLYNTDDARQKINMNILTVIIGASSIIGSIASLIVDVSRGANWTGAFGVAVIVILGVFFFVSVKNEKTAKNAATLITLYMVMNVWAHFLFSPILSVDPFVFLIYPFALCFLLGLAAGLGRLGVVTGNLIICFAIWNKSLSVTSDAMLLVQYSVTFVCIIIIAVIIELLHRKMLSRLLFLTHQITDDSFTDTLTRLLTRRAFNERFSKSIEESAMKGDNIFVIMCDIDHFKNVNDTYGHHIGDEVLKHVADILSKYAMGQDVCFRWGGEEFLIFIKEPSMQRAIDAANRIRVVLEFTHFTSASSGTIKVTMSFGLHQYDKTMSMEKNISVADGYLYVAKQNGRNRVEYAK